MDTKHFKIAADIVPADPTCIAVAARDYGIDDCTIAWSKALDARTHSFDCAGKLMPNDAGIMGKRI
jgi:hypothetical protein